MLHAALPITAVLTQAFPAAIVSRRVSSTMTSMAISYYENDASGDSLSTLLKTEFMGIVFMKKGQKTSTSLGPI